jgi:uncharacterized membrane protein
MSKIPDTPKTKYNHNDPFRWVDSQWEKFMVQQKEDKKLIRQLQKDLGTCTKNYQYQRKQLEKLVLRVPSKYLVDGIDESQSSSFDNNQLDLFEDK